MKPKVLVKGAGEHATGTAHRLFRCGYRVVMTELEHPTAIRRSVAFCSAIFDGRAEVEGVRATRWSLDDAGALDAFAWSSVPVFVDPAGTLIGRWRPDVVIDGRILKKNLDNRLDQAPLVLGFGPGLVAGVDVHIAIETHRGHGLGRLVYEGTTLADTGVPGVIAGASHARLLRAPADGVLHAAFDIGERVAEGQVVATVGGVPLEARVSGVLRGIAYPGSRVVRGQKVGDIDPRADVAHCTTLSDKARTISGSALEAIVVFFEGRLPGDVPD